MELLCPACGWEIPLKQVDLSEDSAFCHHCQKYFDCKEWVETKLVGAGSLRHPPAGAWYEPSTNGFRIVVAADSYRWIFMLPFTVFWSALLFIFSNGVFHAPPETRWQFFLFFITPFALFVALLWWFALIPIFGKITVTVSGDEGKIFKGIGPVGLARHFDWSSIRKVWFGAHSMSNREVVQLEGDRMITVATGINHERLCYLFIALRHNLRHRSAGA